MYENILITVNSQVYNSIAWIDKCVQSVLNQTHKNFEFIIIDNGSTDGTKEILENYALKDRRIKLVRYEKNIRKGIWMDIAQQYANGKYITMIDSDDWFELDYLEKMLKLCEENNLDMSCTGSVVHKDGEGLFVTAKPRASNERIIMDREKMRTYMRDYFPFFTTWWGKFYRRDIFLRTDFSFIDENEIWYGADTLAVLAYLNNSKKICVDNSLLHHYLIRKKSSSNAFDPNRQNFAICLYHTLMNFFAENGQVAVEHTIFSVGMLAVHIKLAVLNTFDSELTPEEKIKRIFALANMPITTDLFKFEHPDITILKTVLTRCIAKLLVPELVVESTNESDEEESDESNES